MRVHVLVLRDDRGTSIQELHILGVGVTQYDYEVDDPNVMVLDYVELNSDVALPENPQVLYHDAVLSKVRGGWRGYMFDYEQDTLATGKTRREAFDGVKASALGAVEAREQQEMSALVDDLLDRVDQYDSDGDSVHVVDFNHDVEGFEG